MITAGDAIERARDEHAAFDPQRNPQASLLRFLSGYVAHIHGRMIAVDESLVADVLVTAFPLADFESGIPLPAHRTVHAGGISVTTTDGYPLPVDLIPFSHRFDRQRGVGRYAWVQEGVLYLRGTATDWIGLASVSVSYVPLPVALAALADALPLPDTALATCAAACARFMAGRGHIDSSLPAIDLAYFAAEASDAESAFLLDLGNAKGARKMRVRDTRGV